jgi:hypothetical protein
MKTGVAIFALFSVVACGGATTSVPAAGDDPGTTKDAGANPMPTTAPTISPHPPPTLPPCTDCLGSTVGWGPNGGLTSFTTTSSLKACRTYERTRIVGNGAPTLVCSAMIGACVAPSISVRDVESALADQDVKAALAGTTTTYGSDSRPCDGIVESITVGARAIDVGGDCTGPTGGCTQQPCVPVPAGLRALVNLLEDLDKQEATAHPECTGN